VLLIKKIHRHDALLQLAEGHLTAVSRMPRELNAKLLWKVRLNAVSPL